jgi:hypothetical protein
MMAANPLDLAVNFDDNLPFIYVAHGRGERLRPVALRKPRLMDND